MKKLLLMCALVCGISAVSFAQGRQRMTPEERAAQMKTSLSLSDDQVAKLTPILTAQAKSQDSLRTALNGDFSGYREKAAPITAAYTARIKAILTADQATAYQKQLDDQAARMRARMQGGN